MIRKCHKSRTFTFFYTQTHFLPCYGYGLYASTRTSAVALGSTRRLSTTRKLCFCADSNDSDAKLDVDVKHRLRALLRETAQSVAVVTAVWEEDSDSGDGRGLMKSTNASTTDTDTTTTTGRRTSHPQPQPHYHGATLSSFTSISMDPYPLVAFSLRIPSRMAVCLKDKIFSSQSQTQPHSHPPESDSRPPESHPHMIINLLSSTQSKTAKIFSRADLYPNPFGVASAYSSSSSSSPSSSPSSESESESESGSRVRYRLTKPPSVSEGGKYGGIPVLENCLGAIGCRLVVPPIRLDELGGTGGDGILEGADGGGGGETLATPTPKSELFIARVVSVESLDLDERTLPLLYWRRGYVTCQTQTRDEGGGEQ